MSVDPSSFLYWAIDPGSTVGNVDFRPTHMRNGLVTEATILLYQYSAREAIKSVWTETLEHSRRLVIIPEIFQISERTLAASVDGAQDALDVLGAIRMLEIVRPNTTVVRQTPAQGKDISDAMVLAMFPEAKAQLTHANRHAIDALRHLCKYIQRNLDNPHFAPVKQRLEDYLSTDRVERFTDS